MSVECNIVFNENDVRNDDGTVLVSRALSEGEMEAEKVIQHPENHVKDENDVGVDYDSSGEVEPKPNTVPFPQIKDNAEDDTGEETESQERPSRSTRFKGNYKGMTAAAAVFEDDVESRDDDHEALSDAKYDLPPDIAAV